ncbi:MAG: Gfo/Idh/MocA family protein, partial [Vicinamibacterales bacterium]
MQTENPKIGIIGCGAATEKLHLPALATLRLTPHLLVDPNLQRAQQLAEKFNVARVAETYESSIDGIDAAIIAVPHHLHARVSSDLLRRGIHVLVEKPLAPTEAECREVVEAARAS